MRLDRRLHRRTRPAAPSRTSSSGSSRCSPCSPSRCGRVLRTAAARCGARRSHDRARLQRPRRDRPALGRPVPARGRRARLTRSRRDHRTRLALAVALLAIFPSTCSSSPARPRRARSRRSARGRRAASASTDSRTRSRPCFSSRGSSAPHWPGGGSAARRRVRARRRRGQLCSEQTEAASSSSRRATCFSGCGCGRSADGAEPRARGSRRVATGVAPGRHRRCARRLEPRDACVRRWPGSQAGELAHRLRLSRAGRLPWHGARDHRRLVSGARLGRSATSTLRGRRRRLVATRGLAARQRLAARRRRLRRPLRAALRFWEDVRRVRVDSPPCAAPS